MLTSKTPHVGCYPWDISSLVTRVMQARERWAVANIPPINTLNHMAKTSSKVVAATIAINSRFTWLL